MNHDVCIAVGLCRMREHVGARVESLTARVVVRVPAGKFEALLSFSTS